MKFLLAATFLVAVFQTISASAISKLATGSASAFYVPFGPLASQIGAIGDPKPSKEYFNAGGFAPQYVELELPCLYTVHNIFLQVRQQPDGKTKHQLFVGPTSNTTLLVHTLEGNTVDHQWIHINFSPPLTDVRFLRLLTVSSPSWVAWMKFLVI